MFMRFRGGGIGHQDTREWEDDYEILQEDVAMLEPENEDNMEEEHVQNTSNHTVPPDPDSNLDSYSESHNKDPPDEGVDPEETIDPEETVDPEETIDPEEIEGEMAMLRGIEMEELDYSDDETGQNENEKNKNETESEKSGDESSSSDEE